MQIIFLILFIIEFTDCINLNQTPISCIDEKFIERLKKRKLRFKLIDHKNNPFKDFDKERLSKFLGIKDINPTKLPKDRRKNEIRRAERKARLEKKKSSFTKKNINLISIGNITDPIYPASFLVSDKWPKCGSLVKNQEACASCWAFASNEVLSDRLCIKNNLNSSTDLSNQYLISCINSEYKCDGGYLDRPWVLFQTQGVVSEACFPYTSGKTLIVPKCPTSCVKRNAFTKYKSQSFDYYTTVDEIKNQIFNYGPISTGMLVYTDFFTYKSGIYELTDEGVFVGGHAVKIIGWGVENGVEFWVAKNSWGNLWGIDGFFKIKINANLGIEDYGIAGYV